jgi:hypothetical protein
MTLESRVVVMGLLSEFVPVDSMLPAG